MIDIDDENTRVVEKDEEVVEPKHLHKKEITEVRIHKKNSDGSCTVTFYEAEYCAGCDTYWLIDSVSEHTYKKCPH